MGRQIVTTAVILISFVLLLYLFLLDLIAGFKIPKAAIKAGIAEGQGKITPFHRGGNPM